MQFDDHTAHADGSAVVTVGGELDVASCSDLWRLLAPLLDRGDVTVDVSAVTFLDCAGLRPLVRARRAIERSGNTMKLHGLRSEPLLVLTGTGLREAFGVTEHEESTEPEGLRDLQPRAR